MLGALLFLAALVGLGAVALRPHYGAPYFAFLLYMRFSDVLRGEFGLPSLFMLLGPALLGLALVRFLFRGEPLGAGWRPAMWLALLYGGICAGSFAYAAEPARTGEALWNYADGLVILLVFTFYLRTRQDFHATLWTLLAAGLVLSSLASFQQLTGNHASDFAGFARTELRGINGERGFRSEGPVSANYFALILIVLVPLAVDRLLHDLRPRARALALTVLATTLASIVFTYSRGAVVALGVVALAMAWCWIPRRRLFRGVLVAALPLSLAAALLLPSDYTERLAALGQVADAARGELPADTALRGRISEVSSAVLMFADHPLLGVGYGNYEVHYPKYAQTLGLDARWEERQAHSLYLEVAAETGILGLLGFGSLLAYAAASVQRLRRFAFERGDTDTGHAATAFGIALLGYLSGSVFLHLTYPRYFWMLLGVAIASGAVAARSEAEAPTLARVPGLSRGNA